MSVRPFQVNVYHFGAAMRSLEVSSCWSKSISLLSDFFALNLEGNVIIYSSCVNACEKSSQWMKALELLREAGSRYIQVDTMIYSAVISAHAQVLHIHNARDAQCVKMTW